jgi:hypothetical protein
MLLATLILHIEDGDGGDEVKWFAVEAVGLCCWRAFGDVFKVDGDGDVLTLGKKVF